MEKHHGKCGAKKAYKKLIKTMLGMDFAFNSRETLKILCLGAHCDDIEIGCGGSILRLIDENEKAQVKWVVFTSNEVREKEALTSTSMFLENAIESDIIIEKFKDGFLPYQGERVKEVFEKIKNSFDPDIIFTHYREDLHQDHRLINELTWNTFRNHLILEYEILKYDGDIGNPNFFIPLDEQTADKKTELILANYHSQRDKNWFDKETFLSMLRLRGVESASKYSEAFYLRKAILQNTN
jgi:LmbE family N-acetylglucosaminyl deacetylase